MPFRVIDRYTPNTHWVALNKASVTRTAVITGNVTDRALRAIHYREMPHRSALAISFTFPAPTAVFYLITTRQR